MTSLDPANLRHLIRVATRAAVTEAMAKMRTPTTLTGRVEQLDEDLDIAYVRMDGEAITTDPTESANYENPGIVPTTRMGETFTDDPVRVTFEGASGASAMRTSTENVIVLPFGAETGRRIVADGNVGQIAFFDEEDNLVGLLDTDIWAVGNLDPPGARVTIDPLGGVRIRSAADTLVAVLNQNGYQLKDSVSGLVTAEISPGSFRMVDPNGTDDVEITTSSTGTLPNPSMRQATEASPSSSLVAPACPTFTQPGDDIQITHVAAFLRATSQAATMTPPAGYTERADENYDGTTVGTLQTSVATLDPADGAAATFTSTQTNWQHGLGTTVVIKGGGAVSPSFRSASYAEMATAAGVATASIAKPTGTAAGDALVVFVAMGVNGGFVPTGWEEPPGFVPLGATFITTGSGSTQSTRPPRAWTGSSPSPS